MDVVVRLLTDGRHNISGCLYYRHPLILCLTVAEFTKDSVFDIIIKSDKISIYF